MLEIIADNVSLNLDDDIQIDLIVESPLTLTDRIPTAYSLTFDLPPTPLNLEVTKYPNRVTAAKTLVELKCYVVFDTTSFAVGLLTISGFDDGKIKAQLTSVSIFDNLRKKLTDVEMEKVEFGVATPRTPTAGDKTKWVINRNDPSNFAGIYRAFHNQSVANNPKFTMGPVRVTSGEWKQTILIYPGLGFHIEITIELASNSADEMYLNFYNQRDFEFNIITFNTRAFPFPYLSYIFDTVFSQTLVENPFTQGELAKLVLICPYHPKYYSIPSYIQDEDFQGMLFDNASDQKAAFTPFYKLNSFMPDINTNDFLKDVMKTFCMSMFPSGDKFRMVNNKDIINSKVVESWDSFLIGELKTERIEKQVYKYGYESISEDYVEIKEENKLNSVSDLVAKVLTEEDAFTGDFLIKTTGEIFNKIQDGATHSYKRLSSGYGKPADTSGNTFDTVSNIAPLPMTIDDYWITQDPQQFVKPNTGKWYVPEFGGDRMVRPTSASIMIAQGIKPGLVNGRQYPLINATNYDHYGQRCGDLSLAWDGPDGLINTYHKEFKLWIEQDKLRASGYFELDAAALKMLDLSVKKNIRGRNFFATKVQITLRKTKIDPAQVELIEAPVVL